MYRKILVLVDDRPVTQSAIDEAIALAQVHRAELFFFCVLPIQDYPAIDMLPVAETRAGIYHAKSAEEASKLLAAASAKSESCAVHSHRATAIASDHAQAVADAAIKQHCDLIVVGTEQQNAVVRLISGNIVPGLISKASVPVLVCREGFASPRRHRHLRRPFARLPQRYRGNISEDDDFND
jgi:nucleotide-binding universal stress UspA family protein